MKQRVILTSECYYCGRNVPLTELRWLDDRERYVCIDVIACDNADPSLQDISDE